jgi:F-type H+-transporting ATPase subunit gamma
MSQLIRMRQRIKAIKTIKKITHALRLISMSTHLRLRAKKNGIEDYKTTLSELFLNLNTFVPGWKHPLINTEKKSDTTLIILVGSQKGLCGNFNTELYTFFEKGHAEHKKQHLSLITIGKKAHDYAQIGHGKAVINSFDTFSMANITEISTVITDYIIKSSALYSNIVVFSNTSKSFFVQKPQITTILPFAFNEKSSDQAGRVLDDYVWEQNPNDIMNSLIEKFLYTTVYELLFQSLVAEQAARFIAMDNSTRSASTLLDSMQLLYNKMRQSKITAELTDLIGGFF